MELGIIEPTNENFLSEIVITFRTILLLERTKTLVKSEQYLMRPQKVTAQA